MPQPRRHRTNAEKQAAYRKRCEVARREQLAAKGLPALPRLPAMPGTVRWQAAVSQAQIILAMVQDEMQSYHDERSEAWQESEKAGEYLERLEALSDIASQLEEWG
jgi:hypothetical protein